MQKFLFSFFLILVSTFCYAEGQDSISVLGWPKDALTNEPVIDNTKAELMTLDSTVIATVAPTWNPRYRAGSYFCFTIGVRSGNFILRVTHPDYQSYEKAFKLKVGKREANFSIGTLRLWRKPKSRQLGEAVVTATKIKFYTKDDTLIYNADAFNLAEGSMLDALVSQLPNAELKRDGRIFVNGKLVESLLLNGKDFFRNDNTILLENLPAYTVQNIKVYNKQSDFAEGISKQIGTRIEEGRFVMDVVLKREYQIGWLNNVEIGGGMRDRWLARLFSLRFTPQSRISVYANANNVHENRKPGNTGDWSAADVGNGISTTESGGIDYRIAEKLDRWRIEGDATVSHSSTDSEMRQSQEWFQSIGSTFSRRLQVGKSYLTALATNHHFQFNLGPDNDRHKLELHFRPNFNYTYAKNAYESLFAEFSENPFSFKDWESVFYGPQANKQLTSFVVNKVENQQRSNSTNIKGGGAAQMNWFIPYTPYYISFDAKFEAGRTRYNSFDFYELENREVTDRRHRYFHRPSDHHQASVDIGFTTPFDLYWTWVNKTSLGYNYLHDQQENSLYRLDWLEEMAGAELGTLPSTHQVLLDALDRANSYFTANDQHRVKLGVDGRYDKSVYRNQNKYSRFRFTWKAFLTMQVENWKFEGKNTRLDSRTAWMPSLGLEVLRNTPGMKHELELQTAYRQQLPPMFSLMGLRFDDDPLNIREGNSHLHRTDVFSAIFFYRSGSWLAKLRRSLSADVRLYAYKNALATAQIYNASTGVRTYRPENVNGNWYVTSAASFYTPLGKTGISLNVSLHENFYHSVDLTATDAQLPVRSTVCTNYLSLPVKVDYSRTKFNICARIQAAWNHAESRREDFQNIDAADISMGMNGNVTLPWNFQLATDFTYFLRRGYANDAMNSDDFVWNAQVSKSLFRGKLNLSIVGYDILGQLSNISYTVNAQGSTETWRNVIPRYAMLRVIYRLNKHPKKR